MKKQETFYRLVEGLDAKTAALSDGGKEDNLLLSSAYRFWPLAGLRLPPTVGGS